MCWNSGVGTRTKSILPVTWLKRVGVSQVSKDCRLTFFSRAPSIRAQGLGTAGAVATKDIGFLVQRRLPDNFRQRQKNRPAPVQNRACRGAPVLANYFGVNPVAKVSRSQDQASVDVQRINLIGADTSTVTTSRDGSFQPKKISVRSCTMQSESFLIGNLNRERPFCV